MVLFVCLHGFLRTVEKNAYWFRSLERIFFWVSLF